MKFSDSKSGWKVSVLCLSLTTASSATYAAGSSAPSELSNPLGIMLLVIAGALMIIIAMMAYVLTGAATFFVERFKDKAKLALPVVKAVAVILLCLFNAVAFAQTGTAELAVETVSTSIGGLSKYSFYILSAVIVLEIVILLTMLLFIKQLISKEKPVVVKQPAVAKEPVYAIWWKKLNNFRPLHEEANLTLNHNYDGIKELDNKLPPWWVYGFILCIVFAGVYLFRAHISHDTPTNLQEYEMAMAQAEVDKEIYLKTAASKVDEHTVVMLTDASALAEGKKIFTSTCAACHGTEGQGTVGPNLTDEYWLHLGGIEDIFKTIKYGIPEKGMKSWKDDFSPVQMAALASYIKSISGTKPANPKEPQGDLYKQLISPEQDTTIVKKLAKK